MNNKEIKVIADAMLEKKGQDVISLDLRSIGTAISDHFIVCSADSTPNVVAIADNVEERMIEKCKRKVARSQGKENAFWVILDYGDIVVHVYRCCSTHLPKRIARLLQARRVVGRCRENSIRRLIIH